MVSTYTPASTGTRTHEHIERGLAHRVRRDLAILFLHSIRAHTRNAPAVARNVQDLLHTALLEERQHDLGDERGSGCVCARCRGASPGRA